MKRAKMTTSAAAASRALLAVALFLAAAPASANGELAFSAVQGHGGVLLNVVEAGNRNGPPILFIHTASLNPI